MKKITQLYFTGICILMLFSYTANAQFLLKKIPMDQQVTRSTEILEAEFVSKKSYWNLTQTRIYTVNTFKVYKVFKGSAIEEVNIITRGGNIGYQAEIVNPSLNFREGDIGLIMLQPQTMELEGFSSKSLYKTYSSVQGFYPYDIIENKVFNPFRSFNDIQTEFYGKITNLTGKNYLEVSKLKFPEVFNNTARLSNAADIVSIAPTTASAGTKTILTITGTNFGSNKGVVSFKNGDAGGMATSNAPEYVDAYSTHITSWTDTEILVEIPSYAGTGEVRVRSAGGTRTFFSDVLTIIYAHTNAILIGEEPPREYLTQLINTNGNGGYTLTYSTNFANTPGATPAFEKALATWVCGSSVNFIVEGTTSVNVIDQDGINIVKFGANDEFEDDGTLGTTVSYFDGCVSAVNGVDVFQYEVDMIFNETINWNFSESVPTGEEIDFETVAVHELGHALLLGHIVDPGAIMHYAIDEGIFNRSPEPNDLVGAEAMFNRSANDPVCGQPVMTASDCSLSTDDQLAKSIVVYPNPAQHFLNIKTTDNVRLQSLNIIDALGRRVISSSPHPSQKTSVLNTSALTAGIYFLELKSDNASLTKKIIIQ